MYSMDKEDKIYLAGHNGMLGKSILKKLNEQNYNNIITKSSSELDLRNQKNVEDFFKQEKPDVVILSAAKVGSIKNNVSFPAEFLIDNSQIEINVINSAFKNSVKNLLFVSSACVYPENATQPLEENSIFKGELEVENEAYGLAKILGIKACEYYSKEYDLNYISVIPTNLYGVNDNFDPEHSHVIPGVMKRMIDAKNNNISSISIWGSGNVYRDFLYVEDAADAIIFILNNCSGSNNINIGSGEDLTIKELVYKIKDVVGYEGELIFDEKQPEGLYRRQLNIDKLTSFGWKPKIPLKIGIKKTYEWYMKQK